MYGIYGDEIVESRTWSSGVEIVARVNWSHIARVRRALGVAGEEFTSRNFGRLPQPKRESRRAFTRWGHASPRAA